MNEIASQRRREAAARVAAAHRPLAEIFAELRGHSVPRQRPAAKPEPEPVEAVVTEAEPVAPEPVAPEPVEAEVAEPEFAAAGAEAEPVEVEPVAPGPEPVEPEAAEPEPVEPEPVEPEVAEPEVAEPAVAEPAAAEPEVEAIVAAAPAHTVVTIVPVGGTVPVAAVVPPVAAVEPDPVVSHLVEADVAAAFAAAVADLAVEVAAGRSVAVDDVALRLAVAAEAPLGEAARAGARAAHEAGVPGDADVAGAGLDIALEALATVAPEIRDALAGGRVEGARELVSGTATRAVALARSAGVAAAVGGASLEGWYLRQRFGPPYCPSPACYGKDGRQVRPLSDGLPPYDERCNCRVEPAR